MIYTLIDPQHPLLNSPLPEIPADTEPENRKELMDNIVESMKHYGGIGLSANQVGLALRMCVFGDNKHYIPFFNPKILEYGGPEVAIEEGCLSYPGLFVKIWRQEWIIAQWEDENRELHKENFTGLQSRVFQHEYDHMQGIDFRSLAGRMALDIAQRKLKRGQRKLKKMQEK